jgi:hypothetical protein
VAGAEAVLVVAAAVDSAEALVVAAVLAVEAREVVGDVNWPQIRPESTDIGANDIDLF